MRPLARDPRVLISWPLPLGFGLGGRLLLTGTAWAGLCLIHHNNHIKKRVHRKVYYILHILQKNYTNKGAQGPGRLLSVEAAAERPQARRTERELSVLVRSVVGLLRGSSAVVVVVAVARAQRRSLEIAIRDVERVGAMKEQLVVVVVVVLGHVDEARD